MYLLENCIAYIECHSMTVTAAFLAFSMTRTGPGRFTASFYVVELASGDIPGLRRAVPRMKPASQDKWGKALPFIFSSKKTAHS